MYRYLIPGLKKQLQSIEHRNFQMLKKRNRLFCHKTGLLYSRETHLWLPCLCLLSARAAQGINIISLQLAGLFHLLSFGTELHWSLSKEKISNNNEKQRILLGDFVYTQIYIDICRYGLEQCLPHFSSLIGSIHEQLAISDLKRQKIYTGLEHEIKAYAMMSASACYLGAHSTGGNTLISESLKEAGYHLGIIKAISERDIEYADYFYENWNKCWEKLEYLQNPEKASFEKLLRRLGVKLNLPKPLLQRRVSV